MKKVYQELATLAGARKRCMESNNGEWFSKHTDAIESILKNELPHGTGLNNKWEMDYDRSHDNQLVLFSSYHAMNENGMYDGWIDFRVVIKPHLSFGITMNIIGNFGKHQDIKDYLYEILQDDLSKDYEADYIIINEKTGLYWSNKMGWVDRLDCDVFSDTEARETPLPVEGQWVRL